MSRIQRLKELCEKATPGPWELLEHFGGLPIWRVTGPKWKRIPECEGGDKGYGNKADADLIAESRTAIPWLISRLEIAEKALERIADNGQCEQWGALGPWQDVASEALAKLREEG